MIAPVKKRLYQFAKRFCACVKATTALEFAFAAPVVFLGAAALVEVSSMMFVSTLVEGGLREAARFGITGFTPAGISREDRIRQIIQENTIGLIDMSTAQITQLVYPSFGQVGDPEPFQDVAPFNGSYDAGEPYQDINGNGQWDPDMGAAGVGGPGDVVLYTAEVDWNALTPLIAPIMGTNGTIRMRASVAVRNEPFTNPPPPAGGP